MARPSATKEIEEVQAQTDTPVQFHHVFLRVGPYASADTQVDNRGNLLAPGTMITTDQFHQWINDTYIKRGWTVLDVLFAGVEDGVFTVVIPVTTQPQARKQTGFRMVVRPSVNASNVMYIDNTCTELLNAGYECQGSFVVGITREGRDLGHWFAKYE